MARSVIIHLMNQDPVLAEMEELPGPAATNIHFTNPRKRDGKPVTWATPGATAFIFSMSQVYFVEVMTSEEERRNVVEFFRER
jgi:hypothetical protein